MTDTILSALIAGSVSIIGGLIAARTQRHKDDVERARYRQQLDDRLGAIEHKLDIHNGYAEKLGEITVDIAIIKTDIKNLKT